ncbi:zinc-binding alcohol dehydrogenase family protein [Robertmurraya sp. P23]|uniref:zinc-binding alcohol dehydrogenase family protein n=1 Tax=Robertmurraya sp. P23 TaxID=3436931 RepID=UPI003D995871
MKAVGLYKYLPIDNEESLIDIHIEKPLPKGKDLLVQIKAISVNPVDTKVRSPKDVVESEPKIIGWDACGVVVEVGEECKLFQPGDEVFYSGSLNRPGAYSEYHLVDERIVGRKPQTLSYSESAAMPLTAITAWEALFERLGINTTNKNENRSKTVLMIGGAGGVGSIAIQLAKWVGLQVIATASREETVMWVKDCGADFVINHYRSLRDQLVNLHIKNVDYILCLNDTDQHWKAMGEVIKPQGKICSIVDNKYPIELNTLKSKSVTFVWEFMFTKAIFETEDMISQHQILNKVSELIDEGSLKTTLKETLSPIHAKNLRKAHEMLESGKTIGKIVLESFE